MTVSPCSGRVWQHRLTTSGFARAITRGTRLRSLPSKWVDLDIDLAKLHHEDGWTWNSGFVIAARIDSAAKIWYGAMRVPFSALQGRPPAVGEKFRINLFRNQGPPPNQAAVVWQPTMSDTFHIPEKFGLLRLIQATAK